MSGPHGPRLTPRGSFEAWREEVRGRAPPWTDADRSVADAIKTYLRDIALNEQRPQEERDSALFALLYKQLTRGDYASPGK